MSSGGTSTSRRVMNILVAPSCFKEGLSAEEVTTSITKGIRRAAPEANVVELPLTDGGEGFARWMANVTGGTLRTAQVSGPLGDPVEASFALLGGEPVPTAAIEIAAAAGLRLIPRGRRNPTIATSRGVGELIGAALDAGAERLVIGCGDAGTSDGGAGMAHALGVRFLDQAGREIEPHPRALRAIASVDTSRLDPRVRGVSVEVACSMHVHLSGERGTARIYAPQKGADPAGVEIIEQGLGALAAAIERSLGLPIGRMPGGGAAGGMGAGLHAFIGAKLHSRYDLIFQHVPVDQHLAGSDLVVTGEGRIDDRTLLGKLPAELGARAERLGIPVVTIAGQIGEGAEALLTRGITAYLSILREPCTLEEAMANATSLVEDTAYSMMRLIEIGGGARR